MIYLDNSATTYPKPKCVARAVANFIDNIGGNPSRGGHALARKSGEIVYDCREALAELFHVGNPERIVFTKNATEALNTAIFGVVGKGDEIIITSMEHNSVLRAAFEAQNRGARLVIVRADADGHITPDAIEAQINARTKLICIIHASNVNGALNDIYAVAQMAKRHGVLCLADCSQSAGVIDIDASKLDMLACSGHKGLMGPMGTGVLYIRDGIDIAPLTFGGTGSQSESVFVPDTFPEHLEVGTLNGAGICGLNAGVRFILSQGIDKIAQKERFLATRLSDGLSQIKTLRVLHDKNGTATISVVTQGVDCVDAASALDTHYNIATRAGLHCSPLAHRTLGTIASGTLRLSVGYFNTPSDIDRALFALKNYEKK
ncbi:MAG: aminotransferase class V-fold PLP-dependent enzyme [Clostridia bacterium]|nr:aminotransferase class V-fold PLP-dependent enzyme [Clostridia bacterium]